MSNEAVISTNLTNLTKLSTGKVRDMYDLGENLLIVTTDRISAFDVIMPNGIPDKGKVLNRISCFWFDLLKDHCENHLISTDVTQIEELTDQEKEMLTDRSMIVKKAKVFPIECVARGYIVGSGWKDYQRTGAICGHELPEGLRISEKLPNTIFTPATKAEEGHDENVTIEQAGEIIGEENIKKLEKITIDMYLSASEYAQSKGIMIADTKFEFGIHDGKIIIIDEVLSPDSSRFWPADKYEVGVAQDSFDKQYVRDYLEGCEWDKTPPAPLLPENVIARTREKYIQAYELLTGQKF
ncbi:MAG: phosphoribosylaminoimidazolesuccinocarboxamide synthase [Planctomycetota bacterium]|nr:MAG: phosphoribosylaminoimidazolesuccinocarboxamide synthase [Planctomycetota bacterium]